MKFQKAHGGNVHHNNNGQVEMTSRQRREANLGIVLISISGTIHYELCKAKWGKEWC